MRQRKHVQRSDDTAPAAPQQVPLPWTAEDRETFAKMRTDTTIKRPRTVSIAPRCVGSDWSRPDHSYPAIFVRVPRIAFDRWSLEPWPVVLAAAEQGVDGLAVTERPPLWRGLAGERSPDPPDVAFLAEGQDRWRGKTVLFQQNW